MILELFRVDVFLLIIESTILLAISLLWARGKSAPVKHSIGILTLAGLTFMPLAVFAPSSFAIWKLPYSRATDQPAVMVDSVTQTPIKELNTAERSLPPMADETLTAMNGNIEGGSQSIRPIRNDWIRTFVSVALQIWIVGVVFQVGRLILGWLRSRNCIRAATPISDIAILQTAHEVAKSLGLKQSLPIRISQRQAMPILVGFWRPTVVIPESLMLELNQTAIRQILLHEFAHYQRADVWIGLWHRLIACAYWFHPLVPLVNRLLHETREELCDEVVIRSEAPASYARTLLSIAESCDCPMRTTFGIGIVGSSLERRVQRLLQRPATFVAKRSGIVRVSAIFLFLLMSTQALVAIGEDLASNSAQFAGRQNEELVAADDLATPIAPLVCRKNFLPTWVTPEGLIHVPLKFTPSLKDPKAVQVEQIPPPEGSVQVHVLTAISVWGRKNETVDAVVSTGNEYSFLPAETIRRADAKIVGEVELEKVSPTSKALLGLCGVSRTQQRIFKVARLSGFDLGVGPPGGELDVLVLEQSNPKIGIIGRNWLQKVRRDEFGLIWSSDGLYFGKFKNDKGMVMQVVLADDPRFGKASKEASTRKVNFGPFPDCDLHVVGVYGAKDGFQDGHVTVDVAASEKPIVLALTSYMSVEWNVRVAKGASIKGVVVAGYFAQQIKGLDPSIPVLTRTYFPLGKKEKLPKFFWSYDANSKEHPEAMGALKRITGCEPATFQGAYQASNVLVDGKNGKLHR